MWSNQRIIVLFWFRYNKKDFWKFYQYLISLQGPISHVHFAQAEMYFYNFRKLKTWHSLTIMYDDYMTYFCPVSVRKWWEDIASSDASLYCCILTIIILIKHHLPKQKYTKHYDTILLLYLPFYTFIFISPVSIQWCMHSNNLIGRLHIM